MKISKLFCAAASLCSFMFFLPTYAAPAKVIVTPTKYISPAENKKLGKPLDGSIYFANNSSDSITIVACSPESLGSCAIENFGYHDAAYFSNPNSGDSYLYLLAYDNNTNNYSGSVYAYNAEQVYTNYLPMSAPSCVNTVCYNDTDNTISFEVQ